MERAEQALSEQLLLENAIFTNRIQGKDPYDLGPTMRVLRKTAEDHARRLIWC